MKQTPNNAGNTKVANGNSDKFAIHSDNRSYIADVNISLLAPSPSLSLRTR